MCNSFKYQPAAKKMAVLRGNFLLFLAIYLTKKAQAQDNFGIVEPFPENIYPIEFTSAQVTCVAFDSTGVKTPDRIQFVRKNTFAMYTNIIENENLYFTRRKVDIGQDDKQLKKLIVTLHIRNVTLEDDSQFGQLGRYECHAYAFNDSSVQKHGFTVNVIRRAEIPGVSVTEPSILQRGDDVTIVCNLTERQGWSNTALNRISWFKNGVLLQSMRNPDPRNPRDFLGPLVLRKIGVRDGGNYTCLLEVKLRNSGKHNVTDSTMIGIAPWLDRPEEDPQFKKNKGEKVSFVCPAQGFPLEVEWKVQKIGGAPTYINESDGKYHIERRGIYDPYVLTVSNLQYSDYGIYSCCVSNNCSSGRTTGDLCQRFFLNWPAGQRVTSSTPLDRDSLNSVVGQSSTSCQIYKGYLFAMVALSTLLIYARNEL